MKSLLNKIHNTARLRWALLGFVLALGAPAAVLVYYSLSELKWETFHQQRTLAIEVTDRINFKIYHWVQVEEQRPYSDYQFLVVSGDPAANYFQPSSLSALNLTGTLPGAIGYFQVGANGEFSSPVLPGNYVDAARYGISSREYKEREVLRERVLQILVDNQLLQTQQAPPAPVELAGVNAEPRPYSPSPSSPREETRETSQGPPSSSLASEPERLSQLSDQRLRQQRQPQQLEKIEGQSSDQTNLAFDNLSQQQNSQSDAVSDKFLLKELEIDSNLQESVAKRSATKAAGATPDSRAARKEQSLIPDLQPDLQESQIAREADSDLAGTEAADTARVTMFESEIYPFEFSPLNSGHLVFYRKVWREGALSIQGLVLDRQTFLQETIGREYRETVLSNAADLTVAYRGDVMAAYRGVDVYNQGSRERGGELLHQARLAAPFNDVELLFTINRLPAGPGAQVVRWSALVMTLVLGLGTWLLYRLGLRQMRLAQQQQDFVSAVSHELKTPLTSIRMYGEMLREGWADETKKRQYYDYIYDESERLSRLIANVLQLARMNRKELDVNVKAHSINALIDNLRSKLHNQIERAGFEFTIDFDPSLSERRALVDSDSFLQIFINLVDNALKFSAKSDVKKINLRIAPAGQDEVMFALRDFGPGIAKPHLNKIFELFYRAENELTRETVGTGIGLALVHQLVQAMDGRVDVSNRDPGAEFRVYLKLEY